MESRKTVRYIRLSDSKQVENYSLEAQERKIKNAG